MPNTSSRLTILCCLLVLPLASWGASYDFDVEYDGTDYQVLPGADDPIGVELMLGDDFELNVVAAGNDMWEATQSSWIFPLSFYTSTSGTRTADLEFELFNNGVSVFDFSQSNSNQSYVHIGTNAINGIPLGLEFDEMVLRYELIASTTTDNTLDSFFRSTLINPNNAVYTAGPVPEPTTLMLLGLAGAGFSVMRRRRS